MSALIYVKFSDETETVIAGSAAAPQPEESWPFQGEVQDTDPRYLAWQALTKPSSEEVARALRDGYLSLAALRIAPLQDAVDLDDATPEELALLIKWKQYRIALNRLDLTGDPIIWPDAPA